MSLGGMCKGRAVRCLNDHGEFTEAETSLPLHHQLLSLLLASLPGAHPDSGSLSYQERMKYITNESVSKKRKTQGS